MAGGRCFDSERRRSVCTRLTPMIPHPFRKGARPRPGHRPPATDSGPRTTKHGPRNTTCARRLLALLSIVIAPVTLAAAPIDPERLLSDYIRIDTTTPQGEHRAAGLLATELHRHGIATRLLAGPENRPNLYAEVGPQGAPAVLLLHHLDVVPANGDDWLVPPFSGDTRAGVIPDSARGEPEIWGRGAIDSKGLGVAHLTAFVSAAERADLGARLIFLATADEENGGVLGLGRLIETHPELFAEVAVAVTEGGVNRVLGTQHDQHLWWGVEFQQKRPLWLEVTFDGRAGHGAKLDLHSAPKKLARAIAAISDRPRVYRSTPAVEAYLGGVEVALGAPRGPSLESIRRAIEDGTIERTLRVGQHQLFLDTVQVTRLRAGETVNVVPATATATLDARLLPDTDEKEFLADLEAIMKSAANSTPKIRVLHSTSPIEASPVGGRWWEALARGLGAVYAGDQRSGREHRRPLVPLFISGATDARYLRQLGIPTYGVSPFLYPPDVRRGIHGVDERVPVKEFGEGVERMVEVVGVLVEEVAR